MRTFTSKRVVPKITDGVRFWFWHSRDAHICKCQNNVAYLKRPPLLNVYTRAHATGWLYYAGRKRRVDIRSVISPTQGAARGRCSRDDLTRAAEADDGLSASVMRICGLLSIRGAVISSRLYDIVVPSIFSRIVTLWF